MKNPHPHIMGRWPKTLTKLPMSAGRVPLLRIFHHTPKKHSKQHHVDLQNETARDLSEAWQARTAITKSRAEQNTL